MDRSLPDPQAEPTISVPRAGAVLGISRAQAYRLAEDNKLPTIKVGRNRVVVPTAKFIAAFGLAA